MNFVKISDRRLNLDTVESIDEERDENGYVVILRISTINSPNQYVYEGDEAEENFKILEKFFK